MKSRFVFLCTLAAFLNPISVFAVDYTNGKTACEDYVAGKILAGDKKVASSDNTTSTNTTSTTKTAN